MTLTIFLVGTTAVGKTKLSIHLAQLFKGQIISCDSQQLYKHADILTAKSTPEELLAAKHHMLNCLNLNQNAYNRNKYYLEANKCLHQITTSNKIPIVVGGTNYYLQTLLYNINIQQQQPQQQPQPPQPHEGKLKLMSNVEKYQLLKQIDPKMAEKLHINDQHRVSNCLEKYYKNGVIPSTTYQPYTHQLRNNNTILFWLRNSNKEQHKLNIAKRIKSMLEKEQGLIQILSVLTFLRNNHATTGGITKAIGYKQFQQLYDSIDIPVDQQVLNYQDIYFIISNTFKDIIIDKSILSKCQQILINNTLQYSKRQTTWIKNRIFSGHNYQHFFILEIEGEGDLESRFVNNVQNKAVNIIQQIIQKGFGSIKQKQQYFKPNQYESFNDWKKLNVICVIYNLMEFYNGINIQRVENMLRMLKSIK